MAARHQNAASKGLSHQSRQPSPPLGQCHVAEEIYNQSVHVSCSPRGQARPGLLGLPSAHQIEKPTGLHFPNRSATSVAALHEDRLTTTANLHGQAMALGQPNVAPMSPVLRCHAITTSSGERSALTRLSRSGSSHLPACHPASTRSSPSTNRTPNPLDRVNYPVLTRCPLHDGAARRRVAFFRMHTLLWLVCSIYLYTHDSKAFREAKSSPVDDELVHALHAFERFLHLSLVTVSCSSYPRHAAQVSTTRLAKTIFGLIGRRAVRRRCTISARSSP